MKFNEGDYAVIVSEAEDMKKLKGELVYIVEILPKLHANDYVIELCSKEFNTKMHRVRENELRKVNKEILKYKVGDMVSVKSTGERAYVNKLDYLYEKIGITFKDGGSIVIDLTSVNEQSKVLNRNNWDSYFMDIAEKVSTRATCDRLHVGCVLVKDKRIVSTGYNGSPSGEEHCDEVGHLYNEQNRCIRTIHAEQNAILFANRADLKGATAYVTHFPCENCAKLMVQSGIKRVVYKNEYQNTYSDYFLSMIDTSYMKGE